MYALAIIASFVLGGTVGAFVMGVLYIAKKSAQDDLIHMETCPECGKFQCKCDQKIHLAA